MSQATDVYSAWLKIPDPDRPLNYYQLLRLKKFEDDAAKVREHYGKMSGHVRKLATGANEKRGQALLEELMRAMLCLTDAGRKEEYDATLGRKQTASVKPRSFEEGLLQAGVLDEAGLEKSKKFADAIGVEFRDAIVQQKLAKYDAVLPIYASSIGVAFLDLTDFPIDANLMAKMPPMIARQHSVVPVLIDKTAKQVLMASPNLLDPTVEDELRLRFNMPVKTVICTPGNVNDLIAKYIPKDAAEPEAADDEEEEEEEEEEKPKKKAKRGKEKKAKTAKSSGPLSDEDKKERLNLTLVAFGMTTIVLVNVLYWGLGQFLNINLFGFWVSALVGLPIAAVVGFVVWKNKS